jgi:hypothetical protein
MRKKESKQTIGYRDGLQISKKTFNGATVGYVVGWWVYTHCYYRGDSETFRSFRNGVVFPTLEAAEEFRNGVEARRDDSGVKFEAC